MATGLLCTSMLPVVLLIANFVVSPLKYSQALEILFVFKSRTLPLPFTWAYVVLQTLSPLPWRSLRHCSKSSSNSVLFRAHKAMSSANDIFHGGPLLLPLQITSINTTNRKGLNADP